MGRILVISIDLLRRYYNPVVLACVWGDGHDPATRMENSN